MDYLNAMCTVDVKSFQMEGSIIWNKYLCGNPKKWNASYISGEIVKTYNNMSEDGTWKKELGEKDQIIALSTKVVELQSKLDKQVIALVTQENKEVTPSAGCGRALAMGKRMVLTPFQYGVWLRKRKKLSKM
jgi:hypothetical protein